MSLTEATRLSVPKKVLIVDDEESLREIIAFDFRRRGYEVTTASNGQEAYEIVKANDIDLVVTDVRMPGGDGIQLLEDIKQHDPFIPVVIFITGFADMTLEDAYARGANQVFSKPFDRKELFSAVEKYLSPAPVKWKRAHERVEAGFSVQLSLGSLGESIEARVLNIGQGGMFIALSAPFPDVSEEIRFEIGFEREKELTRLEGEGVVRWTRKAKEGDYPPGVGVEFIALEPKSLQQLQKLIARARMRAFIPKS